MTNFETRVGAPLQDAEQRRIAIKQVLANKPWPPYTLRKLPMDQLNNLLNSLQEFIHTASVQNCRRYLQAFNAARLFVRQHEK